MKLNPDAPVMRFFARLFDLALLQILFLLTSLPVITIGAGLTAVFSVCRKLREDTVTSVTNSYFADFKDCFKQSTIAWLLMLLCGGLLGLDVFYYNAQSDGLSIPLLIAYVLLVGLYAVFIYLFPLMAWYRNRLVLHFKNALLLALFHILSTVLVGVLYWLVWQLFPMFLPITIPIGITGSAYLATILLNGALGKHSALPIESTPDTNS